MRRAASFLAALALPALVAAAERNEIISKQAAAKEGKVVVVDAGSLDVAVRSSAIDEIRVDVELACAGFAEKAVEAWMAAHRPQFEDTADTFRVTSGQSTLPFFRGVVVTKARMRVVVPPYVRLDLTTGSGNITVEGELPGSRPLRLRSASGELELLGWAPEVEARSTSGDIRLRLAKPVEAVLVRTASGDVELTGGAKTLRCDTSSGELRAVGLLGSVGVATTSGDVSLSFDALPPEAEVRVSSTSGKVRLMLPAGTNPSGEVQSARGEIRSAYPGQTPGKRGRLLLGGPGPKLLVSTTSGRVELY